MNKERNESNGSTTRNSSILYTIQSHYIHCQSAKSAEAPQPRSLTQELNSRGKVINVWAFVLKAKRPDSGGATPQQRSREMGMSHSRSHECTLSSLFFDHMTILREQTVHGCLPYLSVVLYQVEEHTGWPQRRHMHAQMQRNLTLDKCKCKKTHFLMVFWHYSCLWHTVHANGGETLIMNRSWTPRAHFNYYSDLICHKTTCPLQ